MSYTPEQEYELGTVWVPMYIGGHLFMIPIRPKPIQPPPPPPKPGHLPLDFVITPEIRERIRTARGGPEWE